MLSVCAKTAEMLGKLRLDGCYQHAAEPDHNRIRGAFMADKPLPDAELLRQLLRYEPETGKLFWLVRKPYHFTTGVMSPVRKAAAWNGRNAGNEAFTDIGDHGYYHGSINGRLYLAHRVIWAIQTGSWPEADIDHINGVRSDNRWYNLQSVSHAINLRNSAGKSCNTSGVTGVSWRPTRGKWRARIMVDGKETTLGHFSDFHDAVAARQSALMDHGFSARHGRLT